MMENLHFKYKYCPFQLAENTIKSKVLKDFKKIDFLLTGYGELTISSMLR